MLVAKPMMFVSAMRGGSLLMINLVEDEVVASPTVLDVVKYAK